MGKMEKICIVLTGGTIGSKAEGKTIDIEENAMYQIIHLYEQQYGTDVSFEAIAPLQSLSENFTPVHWEQLYQAIREIQLENFDGVIIAHGTDTLSYSSALFGMLFAHISIPMIFIASNYPLKDKRSNGMSNLRSAVDFIKEKKAKGVFTIFQDTTGENIVYLATRILESDAYEDRFRSFGGIPFGRIEAGKFYEIEHKQNPTLATLNLQTQPCLMQPVCFQNEILFIKAYPGLNYQYYSLEKKPKAVLHYLYHSATGCVSQGKYSLVAFIKRCKQENITVYVASLKDPEQAHYSTSQEILETGAIALYNISPEAAYTKLVLAYNQQEMEPIEFMEKNIYYEVLPKLLN